MTSSPTKIGRAVAAPPALMFGLRGNAALPWEL